MSCKVTIFQGAYLLGQASMRAFILVSPSPLTAWRRCDERASQLAPGLSFTTILPRKDPGPGSLPGPGTHWVLQLLLSVGWASCGLIINCSLLQPRARLKGPPEPWDTAWALSHFLLHTKTYRTVHLPLMSIMAWLGRDTEATWAHRGDYCAPHFVWKCLEVSPRDPVKDEMCPLPCICQFG